MKKKLLALFMAVVMTLVLLPTIAFADATDTWGSGDVTWESTGSGYKKWTYIGSSGAEYQGQANYSSNIAYIQIRATNPSGIVTTKSAGKVSSVTVTFNDTQNSANTITVYGSNTAYSDSAALYGNSRGDELGSIAAGKGTTVTFDVAEKGEYAYIGLKSASGAKYIDSISVAWTQGSSSQYTVTAQPNDTTKGSVSLNGSVITATPAEGYYAAGATVSPEGAATVTQNGNTFTVSNVTANCTVTVNFAAKTPVTVTYDGNGATGGTAMADETVYKEDKYTVKDCTYTREGYAFTGWTIDGGDDTLYTAGDEIDLTGDTDFLAQWEEAVPVTTDTYTKVMDAPADWSGTYLIVYDKYICDGTDNADNKTTLEEAAGTSITGSYASSEIVIASMTDGYSLYSTSKQQYMSGKGKDSNGTNFGNTAVAATIAVNNGVVTITSNTNIFSYNSTSGQERFRFFKSGTVGDGSGSYKLVSLYKKNAEAVTTYTVSFNANGGTGTMEPVTKNENAVYTVPANGFTREGYQFTGWKVGNAGELLEAEVDTITITGNVELYAQWEEIVAGRTAGLMASAPADGDHVVIHNTQYNKALGEGEKVNSYYNEGVDKTPVDGVISDVTDNIIWDVTVLENGNYKFSQNGENGARYLSMGNYSSTPYDDTHQEWTVDAYENGYSIQNTGTQKYLEWYASKNYFSGFSPISNNGMFEFLFYKVDAEPEEIEKCTVSFDAGDGTGSMDPVEVIKGASYSLPANGGFTAPEGYVFDGWTIGGGDGTVLEVGASVTIEENTTFIAHYSNNTRTYQLVTSENQLAAGGKYIMVGVDNNDAAWALSKISGNAKYREIVGVTVDGSIITVANSDVAAAASDTKVFELTLGGSAANGWTFHDGFSGYLCATSSGSNNIGVQTDADENGMFTVMIDADGKVHATANGDYTRNQIRYNSGDTRFSCYGANSTQKFFYLYKLVDPMPDGYYLVCDKTDWIPDPMQQFTVNPGANGEYMLNTTLGVGDEIKVVGVQNGVQTWYPGGTDNNYVISDENAGDVTIYFRPDGQGGEGWHYGHIYIADYDFFKTQNLVLSELIGVQFFLDLSVLSPEEKAGSYMTFTITGRGKNDLKTTRVDFADASTNSKGYRGFLCKVNALQMADTITATFHYGDGLTATKDYSVKAYIDKWEVQYNDGQTGLSGDELTRTNDLIKALADYGHYVQPFLATYHGFTIGEGENDYAAMDTYYTDSYDPTTLNKDNYPMTVSGDDTVFGNPTMSLKLDSKTSIRVYLNPAENKDFAEGFSVTVKKGETTLTEDEDFTVTKTGNRYMVEITGVKASELTTMYTIEATNGDKTQTVSAFALTYVGRLLSSETYKDNGQAIAAVCALWNYGILASNY